jgi:hypothetical protein
MTQDNLFNISVTMTPGRTIIACIAAASFLIISALLYDASALVDASLKQWFV